MNETNPESDDTRDARGNPQDPFAMNNQHAGQAPQGSQHNPYNAPGVGAITPDYIEQQQMMAAMKDKENLKTLAICHYVWGGLVGLGALFFIGYMFLMKAMMSTVSSGLHSIPASSPSVTTTPPAGALTPPVGGAPVVPGAGGAPTIPSGGSGGSSMPASAANVLDEVVFYMCLFYGVMAALCLAGCVCNIISGRNMQKQKGRVFSMVVGAINCLMLPLGTILGIFTFVVLGRNSVAQLYGNTTHAREQHMR